MQRERRSWFYSARLFLVLWQHEQWAPLDGLPTLAETMKDEAAIAAPVEALECVIKEDEEQRLYLALLACLDIP